MVNVVYLGHQVQRENLDFKVYLVCQETKEIEAIKDLKVQKEIVVRMEWWEMMDHLDYRVCQEKWAREVFQVLEVSQVSDTFKMMN